MSVAAYVVDLMDRSKISAAGIHVTFVRSAGALGEAVGTGRVDLVIVDLGRPDALDAIASEAKRVPVVAFGSHVDTDRLEAAERAGAGVVLARSQFFADPAQWMRG
jgi:hypothetical protein